MRSDWRTNKTYSMVRTDRFHAALEHTLIEVYRDAGRDIAKMSGRFKKQFDKADSEMRSKLEKGEITDSYYKAWRETQLHKSERFKTMSNQMADRMNKADLQASAYINDSAASIYALNHDFTCFQIHSAGLNEGSSFTLTNERAVRELILGGNHVNFRTVRPDPVRNYNWNQQRIQKIVTNGILTGKSIDGISKDFLGVMGNNTKAAIRNARTAVTSAQAAGCQAAFDQASDMGIEMEKEWIATQDDRTRESHLDLDGERVPYDGVFSNGLRYPCDPLGDPSEVYNCRCTMRAVLPYQAANMNTAKEFADFCDDMEIEA